MPTVEARTSLRPHPGIRLVVFDFDGTISWLRHGWPEIMLGLFRERLPFKPGTADRRVDESLREIVLGLNGRPTLVQMTRFAEYSRRFGGPSPDPEELHLEYQRRLDREIAARMERIREGRAAPDEFLVFGARPLFEKLRSDGLILVILSTTPQGRVVEEAEMLGIAPFFGGRIYGGTGDPARFSKRDVFRRLLHTEGASDRPWLSFGDGPVEIADTKALRGIAIGVCSDERQNGSGRADAFKRRQLLDAGADAVMPDYRDAAALMDYLLGR